MFRRFLSVYLNALRARKLGKTLLIIILVKMVLFFAVMKLLFFPNILKSRFENDEQRSNYVIENLTQPKKN